MRYAKIIEAAGSHPWAIQPEKLEAILELLAMRENGLRLTAEDIAAIRQEATPPRTAKGGIAVIPLFGVLAQRMDLITEASGGTSTDRFARDVEAAVADETIGAVVLDVDSPGGSLFGLQEAAERIYAARGAKPIVAVANSLMASSAYWIGSSADEVYATPSAMVGSIGTVAVHRDTSAAAEREGVRYTLVSSSKYKTEGNAHEALGDEARARIQLILDNYHEAFIGAIARNRGPGVSRAKVRKEYGQGRTLLASEALDAGMVDGIRTLDQVIAGLMKGRRGRTASTAQLRRRMAVAG